MNISITGTTYPPPNADAIIRRTLRMVSVPGTFNTGGAVGVDTLAFWEGLGLWVSETKHRVLYPDDENWNSAELRAASHLGVEFIPITGGYMKRNDALVAACDLLIAFPRTGKSKLRSGTWATVRRADKAGKQLMIIPLT